MIDVDVLHGHMKTHLMGASGGTASFERVAKSHGIPEVRRMLEDMTPEIKQERVWLREMMRDVGVEPSTIAQIASKAGESVARFRPTGRLFGRGHLLDVLEIEALFAAVTTKRNGWRLLRQAARAGAKLDLDRIDELERWADSQLERLRQMHQITAEHYFTA